MFPNVEEHILERNPDFAKLYQQLTTTVLNPDASTKNHPEAKDRAAVEKSLEKHRLKAIKHHLLERAIATTSSPSDKPSPSNPIKPSRPGTRLQRARTQISASSSTSSGSPSPSPAASIPEPLLDLLQLLPPLLDAAPTLPHESLALLLSNPPLSDFKALLPGLADLVSASLHASALALARITHPDTNPAFLHRHLASLPQDLADLKDKLSAAEHALSASRLRALRALIELLQTYAQCLTCLVRSLESKHGVIARSLELRATDISLQAQIAEKESELKYYSLRRQLYTPDVVSALQSYMVHLRDAKLRASEVVRGLKAELDRYPAPHHDHQDAIKEMASAYREMERQMDHVEKDIERLQFVP